MIMLLESQLDLEINKQDLIEMEEKILKKLDFSIRDEYPITFLERFIRLLIID